MKAGEEMIRLHYKKISKYWKTGHDEKEPPASKLEVDVTGLRYNIARALSGL